MPPCHLRLRTRLRCLWRPALHAPAHAAVVPSQTARPPAQLPRPSPSRPAGYYRASSPKMLNLTRLGTPTIALKLTAVPKGRPIPDSFLGLSYEVTRAWSLASAPLQKVGSFWERCCTRHCRCHGRLQLKAGGWVGGWCAGALGLLLCIGWHLPAAGMWHRRLGRSCTRPPS